MASGTVIKKGLPQNLLWRISYNHQKSISANSYSMYTASEVGYSINPHTTFEGVNTEYYPVGIIFSDIDDRRITFFRIDLIGTSNNVYGLRNTNTSILTPFLLFDVVYAPKCLVEVDGLPTPTGCISIPEPIFKEVRFSASNISVNNNASKGITEELFNFEIPEGYKIFSINKAAISNNKLSISNINPFADYSEIILGVRNESGSSQTFTSSISVVFIKEKFTELLPVLSA